MATKAAKKEMIENSLRELRKNTEVLDATFERAGIQVIQQSWQVTGGIEGGLSCYVEVTGDLDKIPDKYVTIKANLYDENGEIVKMHFSTIGKETFTGYETKEIMFYDEGILFRSCKARIFAVRGYQNT